MLNILGYLRGVLGDVAEEEEEEEYMEAWGTSPRSRLRSNERRADFHKISQCCISWFTRLCGSESTYTAIPVSTSSNLSLMNSLMCLLCHSSEASTVMEIRNSYISWMVIWLGWTDKRLGCYWGPEESRPELDYLYDWMKDGGSDYQTIQYTMC